MNHHQKIALLLEDLTSRGIGEKTIVPPLFSLAWKLGFQIPPPHFLGFGALALIMGTFFGVIWGVVMWLSIWRHQGLPIGGAVFASFVAGVLFGSVMAIYYRRKARKLCLPSWSEYGKNN